MQIGAAVYGSESLIYEDVIVPATLGDELSKPIGGVCMLDALIVIAAAANDSPATRWIVLVACVAFGGYFIFVGMSNIRSRYAEEGGKRRLLLKMFGRSTSYEGASAVRMGVMRVAIGVVAIIFGIVFLFVGPVLAP